VVAKRTLPVTHPPIVKKRRVVVPPLVRPMQQLLQHPPTRPLQLHPQQQQLQQVQQQHLQQPPPQHALLKRLNIIPDHEQSPNARPAPNPPFAAAPPRPLPLDSLPAAPTSAWWNRRDKSPLPRPGAPLRHTVVPACPARPCRPQRGGPLPAHMRQGLRPRRGTRLRPTVARACPASEEHDREQRASQHQETKVRRASQAPGDRPGWPAAGRVPPMRRVPLAPERQQEGDRSGATKRAPPTARRPPDHMLREIAAQRTPQPAKKRQDDHGGDRTQSQ